MRIILIFFLLFFSGCSRILLPNMDRAAIACAKGSGPAVTQWSVIYASLSDNATTTFKIDEGCNITAKNIVIQSSNNDDNDKPISHKTNLP